MYEKKAAGNTVNINLHWEMKQADKAAVSD